MDFTWDVLTSREFEVIACNFAANLFPSKKWKLTNSTRDDNHDFLTVDSSLVKWGEAKHSKKHNTIMSRSKWDPTIISAQLVNSVNDILLITCAKIPLSYVVRCYNTIKKPINNVFCIDRAILNEWYYVEVYQKKRVLEKYENIINIEAIQAKINIQKDELNTKNEAFIYILDNINKNLLTEKEKINLGESINIIIAVYSVKSHCTFVGKVDPNLNIISQIKIKSLSIVSPTQLVASDTSNTFQVPIAKGYSIIEFCATCKTNISHNEGNISCSFMEYTKTKKLKFQFKNIYDEKKFIEFERKYNAYDGKNAFIQSQYISPKQYERYSHDYLYIQFDVRQTYNYSKICRLVAHILTGIDYANLNENILKKYFYLADYSEHMKQIILGVFSGQLAQSTLLQNFPYVETILQSSHKLHEGKSCFYILENIDAITLNSDAYVLLSKLFKLFTIREDGSCIVCQPSKPNQEHSKVNDEIAVIAILSSGVDKKYLDLSNIDKSEYVIADIEDNLFYPTENININEIIQYLNNKTEADFYLFFDRIIHILKIQSRSTRILDFMLAFIQCSTKPLICTIKIMRILRDVFYDKTDFYIAAGFSQCILQKQIDQELQLDDMYKEADILNHCGSIKNSMILFQKVSDEYLKYDNHKNQQKGIEALTEVYNIRFWTLDTEGLIADINKTLSKYFQNGVVGAETDRDYYPYYNCLNRKMVTQYLLGDYEGAEESFKINITQIRQENYLAFAYMDSARGLYKKDILMASTRIDCALKILGKLKKEGKELRRYYDCKIERKYIDFILSKRDYRAEKIIKLYDALIDVQKRGYQNIAKKTFYKLAACYLVQGDLVNAQKYLNKISDDPLFNESPRNSLMYNDLLMGFYYLSNLTILDKINNNYCQCTIPKVEFNALQSSDSVNDYLYIETRLW